MTTTTTSTEKMNEPNWTTHEKSCLKNKYSTDLLVENCSPIHLTDKTFPSDAYVVTFRNPDGEIQKDLVRSAKRVNIFDMYYDKFGQGAMLSIDFGPGNVNPKLWGNKPQEEKKKRR